MSDGASPRSVIRGNEWHFVELENEEPRVPVSVIIPARDGQENLDRLLASLRAQDYPEHLIEVILVDDSSDPPLVGPDGVLILTPEPVDGFGAGRARNIGAERAKGDLLLFLDADLLVDHQVVSRLASWHTSHPAAVVTGVISFFDVADIGAAAIQRAVSDRALGALLHDRGSNDQAWRDKHFERSFDLTADEPGLFRVTVGAVMAVPAALHRSVDGLRELGIRGIEDTEYGYRLYTAGALMVLDRDLGLWHQGRRFFDSAGADAAKRDREKLSIDLMATPSWRTDGVVPRRVPVAIVSADRGVSIDGWDHSTRRDAVLDQPEGSDGAEMSSIDRGAAPYRVHFMRSCRLSPDSLDLLLGHALDHGLGLVHVVDDAGSVFATVSSRRAEGRAEILGLEGAARQAHMATAFGEWWLTAETVGIGIE